MIDTLSYMLHLDRLESLVRGRDRDEFKARDSLNSWLSQVYAEIDLAKQRASYFREHGLDMEEMVNSILKEIDGAAGWMSSQK
jgi:hypothetical protein